MQTAMQTMNFTKAVASYFGKLPGQTLMQMSAEVKALSPDDRIYFIREFKKVGINIE